jgi:RHS repeat-associated protein
MRLRHVLFRAVVVATTLTVFSTTVSAVADPMSREVAAPELQKERSVPGRPVAIAPLPEGVNAPAAKPVVWPVASRSEVNADGHRAGRSPVGVAVRGKRAKVAVETFGQDVSKKAGLRGVLLKVDDAGGAAGSKAEVRLDYSGFAEAFSGDYGSRLRFVSYPACVLTTPEKSECRQSTEVPSKNDAVAKQVSADVPIVQSSAMSASGKAAAPSATVLAAVAGNSGSGGDYGATDLSPAGSWSAGGSSGDFTYSVPLTMPIAPGGPAPQLALGYSSGSVDGRTSATNSQASWVGDGWDLTAGGYVERRYTACSEDDGGNQGTLKTGDQCWKDEHFTISLGGVSGKLIKGSDGRLRPEKDDGSKIEKVYGTPNGDDDGESWKVTAPDGTRYFLGLNRLPGWTGGKPETGSVFTVPVYGNHAGEPCNKPAFADSSCTQAYRWNVDLVIDPHGNAMSFYYDRETNRYKRGGVNGVDTEYVAAGRLNRIEYGLRDNALFAKAPALVAFETAERCLPDSGFACDPGQLTEANATRWPDVPFDRICGSGEDCTNRYSPAFFTRKRLTQVVTQSLRLDGSGYDKVDSWSLRQGFPSTGEGAPKPLWLDGVTRTGHVGGTASLPEITFTGQTMDNRVDAQEGLLPITRYRIVRVVGEAGGVTEVGYAEHDCVRGSRMPANPETNTQRCFPMYWSPPGAVDPVLDWFHKYVVTHVTEDARTGGPSQVKSFFEYLDGAAWHYDANDEEDAERRTWSEWRGYGRVRQVKGDPGTPQGVTETLYLRGMDDDTLPGGGSRDVWVTDGSGGRIEDEERLQGFTRETSLLSGGQVVSASVNEPHLIETANDGDDTAYMLRVKSVTSRSHQEDGSWRKTRSSTTYDDLGLPTDVDDEGDVAVGDDEKCTKTTYLRNDTAWIFGYASGVRTIAKPCSAWPGTSDDVLSDVRSAYDGQAYGVAPTRGLVTATQRWTGGSDYQTVSTAKYDSYARTIETTDPDGAKTTTTYTPDTGNPTTITTANRVGWLTKSTMDRARGLAITEYGVNDERSDLEYDALGRLVKVWIPGRSKEAGKTPNTEYAYDYHTDAPTVVTTKSIRENESYAYSYDLYDGMLRQRQTQTAAASGGRILTDTFYDSRGQAVKTNGAYYNLDAPSGVLFGVQDIAVPSQSVVEFDDLGRPLETILKSKDVEQWRTKVRYGGDNTYTTPPKGGTATAVIKNAQGAIVERRQYHALSANGAYGAGATYDATKYSFNAKGSLAKVTDVVGNQWSYEYDHLGRKSVDVDPDRGRTTYSYDLLDQLTSTTDARGKTLAFTYDDLGRKTGTYEGSTSGPKIAEWTFDTLRKGLPTASTRYVGTNAYTNRVDAYDGLNRPRETSVVVPASEGKLAGTYTFESSYSYVTGQLLAELVPAVGGLPAENIIHTYNAQDLPESTYGLNTYASEHQYSPYGETLRMTLGAKDSTTKLWLSSSYMEGTRRLDNVSVKRSTATEPWVADRSFTYDPAGNVTKIADAPANGPADTQCFDYDNLQRMTSAWTPKSNDCAATKAVANLGGAAPYWYDFTFDKIGNRKSQVKHATAGDTTETYDYPAAGAARPHTVTAVNRTGPNGTSKDEFGYDTTGNTTSRKIAGNTQVLDWNAEGRTSKVTEADGKKSEYIYDANGGRLLKKEPNGTTLYLPGHEVTLATGAASPSGKRYYSHGGSSVAMRSTIMGLSYMLGDHHGTDDASVNAENLYVTRRYSDPFGNPRGTAPRAWVDDKGFVGGTLDSTGLTSVGAREYDPKTGRFVSVDPVMDLGDPQQGNGYSYANSNPATFSDPTGLVRGDCGPDGVLCGKSKWMYDPGPVGEAQYQNEKAYYTYERQTVQAAGREANALLGSTDDGRATMADAASDKGFWGVMLDELPDIIGDLTGFNDLRDCFTKFDLWACASILPWGKVLKIVKSATKIFDAVRKAIKWEQKVEAAREKIAKIKAVTQSLVRKGMDKLDDFRKSRSGSGSSCLTHSFVGSTQVVLADGSTKPIAQVKVGDKVKATDPSTGETTDREVVATIVHDDEADMTKLTVASADGSDTGSLDATSWHPVWVDAQGKFVNIGDLKPGEKLTSTDGSQPVITAVQRYSRVEPVYDLTVEGVHTYYVVASTTPVLVHNCGSEDFAHGTGLELAESIIANGLSEAESKAHIVKSKAPGSLFTVAVDPADPQAALDTAAFWGARQVGETCVIVCRIPNNIVAQLKKDQLMVRTDVPNQVVFSPEAFPIINEHGHWFDPIRAG